MRGDVRGSAGTQCAEWDLYEVRLRDGEQTGVFVIKTTNNEGPDLLRLARIRQRCSATEEC